MTTRRRSLSFPAPVPALLLAGTVALAAVSAACATTGDRFLPGAVNGVTNGMTRTEVMQRLDAQPFYTSPDARRMDWGYAEQVLTNTYRHRVTFLFDDSGRTYGIPPGGILGPNGRDYARLVGPQG